MDKAETIAELEASLLAVEVAAQALAARQTEYEAAVKVLEEASRQLESARRRQLDAMKAHRLAVLGKDPTFVNHWSC